MTRAPALAPRRWRPPPAWSRLELVLAAGVTLLGTVLRFWSFTAAPAPHDNPDEVAYAWAGLSLLQRGVPESWSYFTQYASHTVLVTADGRQWPLVHPWLDAPPLFGMLVGGTSWLGGVRGFVDDAVFLDRLPVVLLGSGSVLLVYLLGRRLLGVGAALVGSLLFASAPGAVLMSRAVEPDAATAVLLLVALLALHRVLVGEGGRGRVAALLVCCLLAPLFKVPGVAVGGIAAVALLHEGRWRLALASGAAAVVGLVLFFAYGAAYDWNLFWAVWGRQAANRVGVSSGFLFVSAPAGIDRVLHDGWWLLGWLGVGALLAGFRRGPRQLLLAWPIVGYAAAMLVLADFRAGSFGWYRLPVYGLVYLAAGQLLWLGWRSASPALGAAIAVLGGPAAAYPLLGGASLLGVQPATLAALPLAVLVVVLAIAAARRDDPAWQSARRAVLLGFGALLLLGNVVTSLTLPANYLKL